MQICQTRNDQVIFVVCAGDSPVFFREHWKYSGTFSLAADQIAVWGDGKFLRGDTVTNGAFQGKCICKHYCHLLSLK